MIARFRVLICGAVGASVLALSTGATPALACSIDSDLPLQVYLPDPSKALEWASFRNEALFVARVVHKQPYPRIEVTDWTFDVSEVIYGPFKQGLTTLLTRDQLSDCDMDEYFDVGDQIVVALHRWQPGVFDTPRVVYEPAHFFIKPDGTLRSAYSSDFRWVPMPRSVEHLADLLGLRMPDTSTSEAGREDAIPLVAAGFLLIALGLLQRQRAHRSRPS